MTPRMTGGYVYGGGAICAELLTYDGWSSAYTVENVIVQIVSMLGKARIQFDNSSLKPYDTWNAEYYYKQLASQHKKQGWHTPPKKEG